MSIAVAIGLALLLGAMLSTQAGVNASLRSALGHPLHATLINFVVGIVVILVVAIGSGLRLPPSANFARSSGWMYLGGVIGALYVAGTVVLAPRLGAATLMTLVVVGQLVAALAIDHFGWLGFSQQQVTLTRVVGAVLLVGGAVLIRRG